ncbi:MAG TPA: hypothetical protein VEU30_06915, partial [Thermoanaerobaculia bacterium]|nr:hypothetical protein [Thermoanaerobaculia bacterium]
IYAVATDSNGCRAPYAVTGVEIRTVPPPVISAPAEICPFAPGTATLSAPEEGSWMEVEWYISAGSFVRPDGSRVTSFTGPDTSVTFESNNNGTVTLFAIARDSFYCQATYTQTEVGIRTVPPPVISAPAEICPFAPGTATLSAPEEGSWMVVEWYISSGWFVRPDGSRVDSFTGPDTSVTFESNNTGTVTLFAIARDSFNCQASYTQAEVGIRTIPPPVINAPAETCVFTPQSASLTPPAEGSWMLVEWYISGGAFIRPNGTRVDSFTGPDTSVTFESSDMGTVTIFAIATDSFNCRAPYAQVEIGLRTLVAPDIELDSESVCLNTPRTASVEGTWQSVLWSITGGSITGDPAAASTTFEIDQQTATLTVMLVDPSGCTTESSRTITATSTAPPQIAAPAQVCASTTATATVTDFASFPGGILWSIDPNDGYISGAYFDEATVEFYAFDGRTSVTLTATPVGDGCSSPAIVTIPVLANSPATITQSEPGPWCHGTEMTLTASEGVSYLWSNGATTRSIVITQGADFSVDVTSANGCVSTATISTSTYATPQLDITAGGPTQFCEGGSVVLTAEHFNGATYLWSTGETTRSITVTQPGTYYATGTFYAGCQDRSNDIVVTVDPVPTAVITASSTSICDGNPVTLTASAGSSYLWSNGATTQSIATSEPGSYTVT